MLKKAFVFCLCAVFSCAICLSSCSSSKQAEADVLSAEEIAALREDYPIYTNTPQISLRADIPFLDTVKWCHTAALVEITSSPRYYSVSLSGTLPEQLEEKWEDMDIVNRAYFFEYEAVVLEDAAGILQPRDVITLSCTKEMEECTPELKVGQKLLTLLCKTVDGKPNRYGFDREGAYYVTEDDYILSVFEEEKDAQYTGWKADAFLDKLRQIDQFGTGLTPEERDIVY